MARFEFRSFIPERPRNNVLVTVTIDIAEGCSLAPELVRKPQFFEGVKRVFFCGNEKGYANDREEKELAVHHGLCLAVLSNRVKNVIAKKPIEQAALEN